MNSRPWLPPFSWSGYPKKLKERILKPISCGRFFEDESKERGMRLAKGDAGTLADGNRLEIFWLIDPDDGNIVDAKYLCFGETPLIGAIEAASRWCIGRNYDQARRLSSDLLQREVDGTFPKETLPLLNLVLEAIEMAGTSCMDIPLPTAYSAPPISFDVNIVGEGVANWFELGRDEQIGIIEEILNKDIRPYIALDAGGVNVLNLIEGKELVISYEGSCTSCYSSTGATLSYIQQVLRAKITPLLVVTPDL